MLVIQEGRAVARKAHDAVKYLKVK